VSSWTCVCVCWLPPVRYTVVMCTGESASQHTHHPQWSPLVVVPCGTTACPLPTVSFFCRRRVSMSEPCFPKREWAVLLPKPTRRKNYASHPAITGRYGRHRPTRGIINETTTDPLSPHPRSAEPSIVLPRLAFGRSVLGQRPQIVWQQRRPGGRPPPQVARQ